MMLGIIEKKIRMSFFSLLIVTLWCHPAISVEFSPEAGGRREVVSLYKHLGQNIQKESKLYSNYIDYHEHPSLKIFWKKLEGLNQARDEIILNIRFLEKSLVEKAPENVYATMSRPPLVSGPAYLYLSRFFSNWRAFYFFISGGFFILSSLLVICITCRRNVMILLADSSKQLIDDIDGMSKMTPDDVCDANILHRDNAGYRKAA